MFVDPPQRQSATRVSASFSAPDSSSTSTSPCTYVGPCRETRTVFAAGAVSVATPSVRRQWSAPVGHRVTARASASAEACAGSIHGRRPGSKTVGRFITHAAAWMHRLRDQVTLTLGVSKSWTRSPRSTP
jgi:hypothetical protein